jgi:hypothetical protein
MWAIYGAVYITVRREDCALPDMTLLCHAGMHELFETVHRAISRQLLRRTIVCFGLAYSLVLPTFGQIVIADASDPPAVTRPSSTSRTLDFAIPPQPLVNALDAYGTETGIEILYNSHLTAGLYSPGARGKMSADTALIKLLSGTNLIPTPSHTGVTTLVLGTQAISYVANAPVHGPTLHLDTIRVATPPAGNHHYYAAAMEYAIQNALRREQMLRNSNYRIDMNVWVTPVGGVQNFEFLALSGNGKLHDAIAAVVRQVSVGQAPPYDLPQPVHIQILANGAR